MEDLSFMLINTMISMPVPGIVQLVQSVLLNFIYLDVLLTDKWLPQYIFKEDLSSVEDRDGLNVYF